MCASKPPAVLDAATSTLTKCTHIHTLVSMPSNAASTNAHSQSHSAFAVPVNVNDLAYLVKQLTAVHATLTAHSAVLSAPASAAVVADMLVIDAALNSIPLPPSLLNSVSSSSIISSSSSADENNNSSNNQKDSDNKDSSRKSSVRVMHKLGRKEHKKDSKKTKAKAKRFDFAAVFLAAPRQKASRKRSKKLVREACERARLCAARLDMLKYSSYAVTPVERIDDNDSIEKNLPEIAADNTTAPSTIHPATVANVNEEDDVQRQELAEQVEETQESKEEQVEEETPLWHFHQQRMLGMRNISVGRMSKRLLFRKSGRQLSAHGNMMTAAKQKIKRSLSRSSLKSLDTDGKPEPEEGEEERQPRVYHQLHEENQEEEDRQEDEVEEEDEEEEEEEDMGNVKFPRVSTWHEKDRDDEEEEEVVEARPKNGKSAKEENTKSSKRLSKVLVDPDTEIIDHAAAPPPPPPTPPRSAKRRPKTMHELSHIPSSSKSKAKAQPSTTSTTSAVAPPPPSPPARTTSESNGSKAQGGEVKKERNMWRAASMYKLAADGGDARAMCDLATCYQNGIGVNCDKARAVELFRSAAEAGLPRGQFCLARCYAFGEGVTRDVSRAVELYEQAADGGHAAAMCNLGVCYQKGVGVSTDHARAIELYKQSGTRGYARAWYNLGVCYESGAGVTEDISKAVGLYKKSARGGFASAMCTLGACYESGTGVAQDLDRAVVWYKRAAKGGCVRANFFLGLCYERGAGVGEKNLSEAVRLFKKAAHAGLTDAALYLKSINVSDRA